MKIDELRELAMQRAVERGLAVRAKMPGQPAGTLYFASEESRDDFMRRAEYQGGVVEIATRRS